MSENPNAPGQQVGGTHYAEGGDLQHWDFVTLNFGPGYLIGCATKYVSRWRKKDGVRDLEKSLHYVRKLKDGIRRGLFFGFRGSTEKLSVNQFAEANGLMRREAEICHLLSNWDATVSGLEDLDMAERMILVLIEKAKVDPEGR